MNSFVIVLSHPKAQVPQRGSPHAAGYDLCSVEELTIPPRSRRCVPTGLKMTTPIGHYGRIASRSGTSFRNGIEVGAGVIDHDYTGLVGVMLYNHSDAPFGVCEGMKIAQIILEKYCVDAQIVVREALEETERGAGGFGSTGV